MKLVIFEADNHEVYSFEAAKITPGPYGYFCFKSVTGEMMFIAYAMVISILPVE